MKWLLMLEPKTNKISSLTLSTPPFLKKNAAKAKDMWVLEDNFLLFCILLISERSSFSFFWQEDRGEY